jgi:DNA-binding Lrp family transcriptional regulator
LPIKLDEYDISMLMSLFKDGRKSFRQISRKTGITTHTVKARFERLVNVGFIQGVMPVIDFGKIGKALAILNYKLRIKVKINSRSSRKVCR